MYACIGIVTSCKSCKPFDGLRENEFRADHFQAWQEGRAGYPFIDACMRYLIANGWIKFRMRAFFATMSRASRYASTTQPSKR